MSVGKSTLLIDVLFQECQRQYLEAMSLQGIQKPRVERIQGVSPAIVISQTDSNKNPRSTAGTVTDVYTFCAFPYSSPASVRKEWRCRNPGTSSGGGAGLPPAGAVSHHSVGRRGTAAGASILVPMAEIPADALCLREHRRR